MEETAKEKQKRLAKQRERDRDRRSCSFLRFSSVSSKPRCTSFMQTWLHWISQCCASLVSRPSLVPWQREMKEGIIRGEQDWRLPIPMATWRLAFTLLDNLWAATGCVTWLLYCTYIILTCHLIQTVTLPPPPNNALLANMDWHLRSKGYLTACVTHVLNTTCSRLPHNALHSLST